MQEPKNSLIVGTQENMTRSVISQENIQMFNFEYFCVLHVSWIIKAIVDCIFANFELRKN